MTDNSNAIVFEQMLNTFYNNSANLGLSERQNRIISKFAISYGHGGIVKVAKASGLSRKTERDGFRQKLCFPETDVKPGEWILGKKLTVLHVVKKGL